MLRLGVTGIICGSDVLALGAVRAVRRAGLTVPGDVSVVGYLAQRHRPPADHRPPAHRVHGQVSRGPPGQPDETVNAHPEELLFEPELVVRGSTGPARAQAPGAAARAG
jgi:hypothetical protein